MKKLIPLSLFTIMMFVLPLFTGCGGDRSSDAVRYFMFEADRATLKADTIGGNICVKTFRMAFPFNSSNFVYKKQSKDYEYDYYNRFISSPEVLISQQCRNWLEKSGIFENVLNTSSIASADYVLEGNIINLYGDFAENDLAWAVMKIRFYLIKETKGEPVIMLNKGYEEKIEVAAASPEELVSGYGKCMENVLSNFESDLGKLSLK